MNIDFSNKYFIGLVLIPNIVVGLVIFCLMTIALGAPVPQDVSNSVLCANFHSDALPEPNSCSFNWLIFLPLALIIIPMTALDLTVVRNILDASKPPRSFFKVIMSDPETGEKKDVTNTVDTGGPRRW